MAEQEVKLYSDEKVLLKTSFLGGFEKKEVLEYIDKLREQNRSMGRELEERINEIAAARDEFTGQVSSFEAKLTEMERQLEERSGKIKDLSGEVESLRGEIGRQKRQAIEQEVQLSREKDTNKKLVLQAQSFEHKARRYDEFSSQLGDILLESRQRADEKLAEAEKEAEKIKHEAVETTLKAIAQIKAMRSDLQVTKRRMENVMQELSSRIDELDGMFESAIESVKPCGGKPDGEEAAKTEQENRETSENLFFQ